MSNCECRLTVGGVIHDENCTDRPSLANLSAATEPVDFGMVQEQTLKCADYSPGDLVRLHPSRELYMVYAATLRGFEVIYKHGTFFTLQTKCVVDARNEFLSKAEIEPFFQARATVLGLPRFPVRLQFGESPSQSRRITSQEHWDTCDTRIRWRFLQ